MAIGQRIKYFLNRIGMTQKQLGEQLVERGHALFDVHDPGQLVRVGLAGAHRHLRHLLLRRVRRLLLLHQNGRSGDHIGDTQRKPRDSGKQEEL